MNDIILHNATNLNEVLEFGFHSSVGGKIVLLYGNKNIFQVALLFASHLLLQGTPIAIVDGGCHFDLHIISRFARQRHVDSETLLNRIYVSRGFTSYQMEAAINNRLVSFMNKIHSKSAMIFGLLDTFYDEQVRFIDARNMLRRIIFNLDKMRKRGISLLVAVEELNILPKERNVFLKMLKQTSDVIYKLVEDEEQLFILIKENIDKIRRLKNGTYITNIYKNNRQ